MKKIYGSDLTALARKPRRTLDDHVRLARTRLRFALQSFPNGVKRVMPVHRLGDPSPVYDALSFCHEMETCGYDVKALVKDDKAIADALNQGLHIPKELRW